MIPANSVYPNGVPSIGMTTATFDANPNGSIENQGGLRQPLGETGGQPAQRYLHRKLRLGAAADVIRQRLRRTPYQTDNTTPSEFRGDEDPSYLWQLEQRRDHAGGRLSDRPVAVPAAEWLFGQHLVVRSCPRHLHSPVLQRKRHVVQVDGRAACLQDRYAVRAFCPTMCSTALRSRS